MKVLFTGGASQLGGRILRALLNNERTHVWAGVHRRPIAFQHPRLQVFNLDIERPEALPQTERVIHFAGVTHAADPHRYWDVNHKGTIKLAKAVRERGAGSFLYVSTRCATPTAGTYGESKLQAENDLQTLGFTNLTIIRPSEIYGGESNEGIDQMIILARKWHIVPLMFGSRKLRFAPLTIDDFVTQIIKIIESEPKGKQIIELCGPEDLSSVQVALRIARRYYAVPVPVWWPGLVFTLRTLGQLGLNLVKPDQLARAIGDKTCSHSNEPALKKFLSD